MAELPTGTVTLLFTDVVGASRPVPEERASSDDARARRRAVLVKAFHDYAGIELGSEGDSFLIAFEDAAGAVSAAVAAQRALHADRSGDGTEPSVRMGLTSGEAEWRAGQYLGLDVHGAARVATMAHGGQILISNGTRELVEPTLGEGVSLVDLGILRVADSSDGERLFQVSIDGLPTYFSSEDEVRARHLPASLTSFLGRTNDIAEVSTRLARTRLLTLVGPGGVGKTRLSLEVARRMAGMFDGVWYIELAPLREPGLVSAEIAAGLSLVERGGADPLKEIVAYLRDRPALLVLDNFEHLQPASADISTLLRGTTRLTLLVTSRAPIRVYGEQQFEVSPLPVPTTGDKGPSASDVGEFDAVALFVDRASASAHGFELTDANAGAVAQVCAALDGLPLAIELAAARATLLTPAQIANRLGERLTMRSASSDLPVRQQTLHDAIDWSHALLDSESQELFAELSVFVGGATLTTVEALFAPSNRDVSASLSALLDSSLVRRIDVAGETRFGMLETIRAFADGALAASGRREETRQRHAAYFMALAAEARPELVGSDAGLWLDKLEAEIDNLRAAIDWAMTFNDVAVAVKLAADLWRFWQRRGYLDEGSRRIQAALELQAEIDPVLRADALEAAGGLAYWQADARAVRPLYEQALAARRALGDRRAIAEALYNLSFSFTWLAMTEPGLEPDVPHALELLEEADSLFTELDDAAGLARTGWGIATAYYWDGRFEESRAKIQQILADRASIDMYMLPWILAFDALSSIKLEQPDLADKPLLEALELFTDAQDITGQMFALEYVAHLASIRGDRSKAAAISGGVRKLEARVGVALLGANLHVIGFDPDELQADPALTSAWEFGSAMGIGDLVKYAMATDGRPR